MRELIPTSAFSRALKNVTRRNNAAREATMRLMSEDVIHPSLRTHKLKGDLDACWSSSAGYDLRIIFEFIEQEGSEALLLLTVGPHDEVY